MQRFDLNLFLELNEEYRMKPLVPAPPKYDLTSLTERADKKAGNIAKKVSVNKKRVLEIGCGRGEVCRALAQQYQCDVVGVDVSIYKEWLTPCNRVKLIQRDLCVENTDDLGIFDLIYSNSVWEHVRHPFSMLRAAHNHLNINGDFLLSANLYRGPKASHRYREVFFPWPHLLFSDDVFHDFYNHLNSSPAGEEWHNEKSKEPSYQSAHPSNGASWVNQLSIADYFLYFKLIGFELVNVKYSITPIDESFYERFSEKLERFPRYDLERDFIHAHLRKCPPNSTLRNETKAQKMMRYLSTLLK